LVNENVNFRLI